MASCNRRISPRQSPNVGGLVDGTPRRHVPSTRRTMADSRTPCPGILDRVIASWTCVSLLHDCLIATSEDVNFDSWISIQLIRSCCSAKRSSALRGRNRTRNSRTEGAPTRSGRWTAAVVQGPLFASLGHPSHASKILGPGAKPQLHVSCSEEHDGRSKKKSIRSARHCSHCVALDS
jgi:hypothetical protein